MTVEGLIKNGQIILNQKIPFPDGAKVRIEVVGNGESPESLEQKATEGLPSLYDRLKPYIGSVKGLPADFAINHDHYLHGQPKRQ